MREERDDCENAVVVVMIRHSAALSHGRILKRQFTGDGFEKILIK